MNATTQHTGNAHQHGGNTTACALSAHLGTCPTCVGGPVQIVDEYDASVAPALCPTCGQTSVEYGMILEMDAILARLNGLDALDRALERIT